MFNPLKRFFSKSYHIPVDREGWVAPEETLVDSASRYADLEQPISPTVFRVFFGVVVAAFLIVAGFVMKLSVFQHDAYADLSFKNKTVNFAITPPRGIIMDRTGKPLVQNVPSFDVLVVTREARRELEEDPALPGALAGILGRPEQELQNAFSDGFAKNSVFFIASGIDKEQVLAIKRLDPRGVYVITSTKRAYPSGSQFSSIIGYSGKVSGDDLARDSHYLPSDSIGRLGIEAFYERELRGSHGRIFFARDGSSTADEPPVPGRNVVLHLDADMQKQLYNQMYAMLKEANLSSGAAIVQDPRTGAVLAMVSFPSYDNNIFNDTVSAQEYERLFESRSRPLFNRVISGLYSPGSTIKPLIGMAALQEGVVTPSDTIRDCIDITIPNPFDPEHPYVFKNWRPDRGLFNIRKAIAQSCNIYFFSVGGGFGNILGLGADRIVRYLTAGLANAVTGIDLPGENSGFVPTPEWKLKTKRENWYQGDTYNVSIGQGDLVVTPLWLNTYISAIANGGTLYKPLVADTITDELGDPLTEFQPQALGTLPFRDDVIREVRNAMRDTVLTGTAQLLKDLPVPAAAKTGTAEVVTGSTVNSLFTAFAPFQTPEVSITVLMEGSASNQGFATRAAHGFLRWYFQRDRGGQTSLQTE